MRTLFVTGGAGFIGSNFIRYWLENHTDDKIINFDLLTYAGNLENLIDVAEAYRSRYFFVYGDIRNEQLLRYLFEVNEPDFLVNFAAESHNSLAVVDPGLFVRTNVLGTQALLEAARHAKVPRLHHVSTCEVYGDLPLDSDEKFSESSPFRPRTPYNASKASADLLVKAYVETFLMHITVSNCSNNFGPYQFPEKVIPLFTINALTGGKMPLYKSSRNKREWLHVTDHCHAIELILLNGQPGETYNVGSGVELDVEAIADKVISVLSLDQSYKEYVDDRPGYDRRYLLDSTKIKDELGWSARTNIDELLEKTILWYRDNRTWWKPLLKRLMVDERKWSNTLSADPTARD